MGTRDRDLGDYEVKKIEPMQSTDGSPSNWVTVYYEKKNKMLTIKGAVSASQ